MTYNYTITPSPPATMMSLSTNNECIFTFISGLNNSFANTYNVTIHAYDYNSNSDEHGIDSFNLILKENEGPKKYNTVLSQNPIARIGLNYTLPSPLFTDNEGDSITISHSISPNTPLITIDSSGYAFINVSDAATNADAGTYTVTLTAADMYAILNNLYRHPDTTQGVSTFDIVIAENSAPVINETLESFNFTINRANSYTHTQYAFFEIENEAFTVEGSFSTPIAFITYNNNTRVFTSYPTVDEIGTYQFELVAYDAHPDTGNNTQTVR